MGDQERSLGLSVRWLICEHCDSLYGRIPLQPGQVIECTRCGAVLERHRLMSIQAHLALSITAALLFVFSNTLPLLTINIQGLTNQTTLSQSVFALGHGLIMPVAIVAGATVILVPMVQIALLCWLYGHACYGRVAPGFRVCMRAIERLRPWNMLEVCLLGILVALIKLAGMLDVHPGFGLWTLSMLAVLLILVSDKSVRYLWEDFREQLK
ncbi:paraquat-inducible protein A [Pseudomonas fulva]|uniref:paraquat-inducible protein A n=1 Tax=Pseudomonas fulva TaxID=47880 RepID=UPI00201E1F1E|nr:paraquat-inducible protein A [Pseudomonas fulva]UQY33035.1 paraquat-inducible protein A [Pseudomonas fulva]